MAPLPQNNTARLFLDYTDSTNSHTISWRYNDTASDLTAAMAALHSFLDAIQGSLYAIVILGARVQLKNASVSVPTAWTGDSAYGTGLMPAVNAPRELRFQGRDDGGRRVSLSVYGGNFSTPATYRINSGVSTDYDNGILQLILAADTLAWVTINDLSPVVYDFVSVNFNSYWEEQARG